LPTKWLAVDDALNFDASQNAKEALRAEMSERTRLSAVRAEIGMALARQGTLTGMLHTCAEAMVRHLDAAFARIWTPWRCYLAERPVER
jgi:hypothetical protein